MSIRIIIIIAVGILAAVIGLALSSSIDNKRGEEDSSTFLISLSAIKYYKKMYFILIAMATAEGLFLELLKDKMAVDPIFIWVLLVLGLPMWLFLWMDMAGRALNLAPDGIHLLKGEKVSKSIAYSDVSEVQLANMTHGLFVVAEGTSEIGITIDSERTNTLLNALEGRGMKVVWKEKPEA